MLVIWTKLLCKIQHENLVNIAAKHCPRICKSNFPMSTPFILHMHFKFINSRVANCYCDHALDAQMDISSGSGVTVDSGVENRDTPVQVCSICMTTLRTTLLHVVD